MTRQNLRGYNAAIGGFHGKTKSAKAKARTAKAGANRRAQRRNRKT